MKDKLKTSVEWLRSKGVDYADCRLVRRETESLRVTDAHVDTMSRDLDVGVGMRVLSRGAWGFAATASLSAAELKRTANKALQIARASAMTTSEPVVMAEQEAFVGNYGTPFKKDPFKVAADQKIALLLEASEILKKSKKIKTAEASMDFYRTHKLFVSSEGAQIEQDIIESGACLLYTSPSPRDRTRSRMPSSA